MTSNKNLHLIDVSIDVDSYQNWLINECARRN